MLYRYYSRLGEADLFLAHIDFFLLAYSVGGIKKNFLALLVASLAIASVLFK